MRFVDRLIHHTGGEEFSVYGIGDTHKGAKLHRRDLLQQDIERVAADPHALWVHLGDVSDAILPGDKRFRASEVEDHFLSELDNFHSAVVDELEADFSPIAEKCLGVLLGNHDITVAQKHGYNAAACLADRLRAPYLSSKAVIRLRFANGGHVDTVKLHVWHGSGGGATAGAVANHIEKQMLTVDADVHMCGHFHRKAVVRRRVTSCTNRGALRQVKRSVVGFATGAYLDDYVDGADSYVEDKNMSSWDLGASFVAIRPTQRRLRVVS